jgi:hypothetical protein
MQIYSCLITREKISISSTIPHFKINNITTIPINLDYGFGDLSEMIALCKGGLLGLNDLAAANELSEGIKTVVDLIYKLDLQNREFAVIFTSEWGAPLENIQALFKFGKLIQDATYIADHNSNEIIGVDDKIFEYLDLPGGHDGHRFIAYYNDYGDALKKYKSALP